MDDPRARKQAIRRGLVERILGLDPDDRRDQEAELARRFASLPGFEPARLVLLYVSTFPEEIATGPMLRQSLALGKRLICPRVDRVRRRLQLFEVGNLDTDLVPGMRGIPEPRHHGPEVAPDRVDWVLVPGLGFDERGYRIGRGAGHYDRLLPTLRPETPCWALALDCQWVEDLPVEPHDVPLDGVVTPGKTVVASNRGDRIRDERR